MPRDLSVLVTPFSETPFKGYAYTEVCPVLPHVRVSRSQRL